MCRWGCPTVDTTYKCRWCGTRFCRECLRGDFSGCMWEAARCRVCNQVKCIGERVEYVEKPKQPAAKKNASSAKGRGKIRGKSSKSKSTKSAKSTNSRKSKSAKSAKNKKIKKKK